jgi:hypothetical protein
LRDPPAAADISVGDVVLANVVETDGVDLVAVIG